MEALIPELFAPMPALCYPFNYQHNNNYSHLQDAMLRQYQQEIARLRDELARPEHQVLATVKERQAAVHEKIWTWHLVYVSPQARCCSRMKSIRAEHKCDAWERRCPSCRRCKRSCSHRHQQPCCPAPRPPRQSQQQTGLSGACTQKRLSALMHGKQRHKRQQQPVWQ